MRFLKTLSVCFLGLFVVLIVGPADAEDLPPVAVAADDFNQVPLSVLADVVTGPSGSTVLVGPGSTNVVSIEQCLDSACVDRTKTEIVVPVMKANGGTYYLDDTPGQAWSISSFSADVDSSGRLFITYLAGSSVNHRSTVLIECANLDCDSPSAAAVPFFVGASQEISFNVGPNGPVLMSRGPGGLIRHPLQPHGIDGIAVASLCETPMETPVVSGQYERQYMDPPRALAGQCFEPYACTGTLCSTGFAIQKILDGDDVAVRSNAVVSAGSTGPIVTYIGDQPGSSSLALISNRCLNQSCSDLAPAKAIASAVAPQKGAGIDATINSSGHPVIVYTALLSPSEDNQAPRVIVCEDPDCGSFTDNQITTFQETSITDDGWFPQVALDENEHPVVAYIDTLYNFQLRRYQARVVRCLDRTCSQPQMPQPLSGVITSAKGLKSWIDSAGNPSAIINSSGRLYLKACDDPQCLPVGPPTIPGSTHSRNDGPLAFTVETHGVNKIDVYVGDATEPALTQKLTDEDPCKAEYYKCTHQWTVTLDNNEIDLPAGPTTIRIETYRNSLPVIFPITLTDDDVPGIGPGTLVVDNDQAPPITGHGSNGPGNGSPVGNYILEITDNPVFSDSGSEANGAHFDIQTNIDLAGYMGEDNRLNLWFCLAANDCDGDKTTGSRPLGIAPITITKSDKGYIGTLLLEEIRPGTAEIYPAAPNGCLSHWMVGVDFRDPIATGQSGVCFGSHIDRNESKLSFTDLLDPEMLPASYVIANEWVDGSSRGTLEFYDGERRTIYFDSPDEILPGPTCSTQWSAWQLADNGIPQIVRSAVDGRGGREQLCITLP